MDRLLSPDDEALQRKVARSTLVTRLFIITAILVGGACLVVLLQLASSTNQVAGSIRNKQNDNAPVLASIQSLARDIRSCTDPSGECAKRGQRQQAKALGTIRADTRDVVVATLVCQQRGVAGFDAITACVNQVLVTRAAHPSLRPH